MLTPAQWQEWQLYAAKFLTPMRRADLNTALTRADARAIAGQRIDVMKLLPVFGKERASKQTDEDMKLAGKSWVNFTTHETKKYGR